MSRVDTMPAGMVEKLSRRPPRVGDVLAGRVIGRKVAVKLLFGAAASTMHAPSAG